MPLSESKLPLYEAQLPLSEAQLASSEVQAPTLLQRNQRLQVPVHLSGHSHNMAMAVAAILMDRFGSN